MTTPMERALKNLGDVTNVMGPLPISSGALQSLCALLAAEIIAEAIKEAVSPKDNTATIAKLIDQITEGSQQKSEHSPDKHQHSQEPQ